MATKRERDLAEVQRLASMAMLLAYQISLSRDIRTEEGLQAAVEAADLMDQATEKMEAVLKAERAYKGDADAEV